MFGTLAAAICIALAYLGAAFTLFDVNPAHWGSSARGLALTIATVFALIAAAIASENGGR